MTEYKVLGIEHVHITTPAELENEVVEWYCSCLNLEEVQKPEGTRSTGRWLRAGSQEVHISIDEHNPPRDAHFGLVVDAFEPVVECLRAKGFHIEQATTIPGRHRFFTRDPAGNRVEIVHFDQPKVLASEEAPADERAQVVHEEKTG